VCLRVHVCYCHFQKLLSTLDSKKNRIDILFRIKTIWIPYFEQQNYGSANLRGYAKQEHTEHPLTALKTDRQRAELPPNNVIISFISQGELDGRGVGNWHYLNINMCLLAISTCPDLWRLLQKSLILRFPLGQI